MRRKTFVIERFGKYSNKTFVIACFGKYLKTLESEIHLLLLFEDINNLCSQGKSNSNSKLGGVCFFD